MIRVLAFLLVFVSIAAAQTIITSGGSGAPTGAAGGDLTGTYPNPTIKSSVTLTTPNIGAATATTINGATIDNLAWTAFTPTVTCTTSGTITTDTVIGRFKILGKTVFVQIQVLITTLGSCLGNLSSTLPGGTTVNSTGVLYPIAGINSTNAVPITTYALGSSITMLFAAAPAANNYYFNGTYESN